MAGRLREGIYEHVVTRGLASALEGAGELRVDLAAIERVDLPGVLARHISREIEVRLRGISDSEEQVALANALLTVLEASDGDELYDGARVDRAQRLYAVYRALPPARPMTPLGESALLTRTSKDPVLGHELKSEIASSDAVDVIAAFITLRGIRQVWPELEALSSRGGRVRVLTTVFTGSTELRAVDALARLPGCEVRVSYDVGRTRLHAKAWLFSRDRGGEDLHTAYVGSANLTHTALSAGQEWTIKASAGDVPHVVRKFRGTFEALWNEPEFEAYDGSDAARARLRDALADERGGDRPDRVVPRLTAFRAKGFQREILDKLVAERELHGHKRNLVVAATGTGKTVIAAFDYVGLCERTGSRPRMLFVAHRREILEQARATFRRALCDGSFGEMWGDGDTPERFEHVFASVQTAARSLAQLLAADHFRYVVIDECHHLPAESYQRMMRYLNPDILLGITATPERSDGRSLLPDFGDRVAAELRLWHALEKQLLVPFEYYGLSDGVDLSRVKWSRSGYGAVDLEQVYTGNEARVDLIVAQLTARVGQLDRMRALAFCVSVEHTQFMARAFEERGIHAVAVHGQTVPEVRDAARARLERGEIQIICTCDLYNEGVDLPFVDTLLLLRPTASATLFMQQLGRGLRNAPGKTSCLVLDFIGQHRAEFRFDEIYEALTGVPKAKLESALSQGFPFLPSGCVLELDAVAQKTVLASLKRQVPTGARLANELKALATDPNRRGAGAPTLAEYLAASGREVEEVYRAGGFSTLLGRAGLGPVLDETAADLSGRLGNLAHVDEPARLEAWRALSSTGELPGKYAARLTMLDHQLHRFGVLRRPDELRTYMKEQGIATELAQLVDVLEQRVPSVTEVVPVAGWPLSLHRRYSTREIATAVGFAVAGHKARAPQRGVYLVEETKREVLFVTLDKSDKSFSPTTRYRDYAVSPRTFHWETQSSSSPTMPSGKRYAESPGNGWTFYLFVRENPSAAFAFLGPVKLSSFSGDRPMSVTWELEYEMPVSLFERFATLA